MNEIVQQSGFLVLFMLIGISSIMFYLIGMNKKASIIRAFYVLGTVIQLEVYGEHGEKAIEDAVNRLNEIDNKMSTFKECSEISMINRNAGGTSKEVSEDTYFVIKKAVHYSKLSEGAFDPTIKPIVSLWGIGTDSPRVPNKNEIVQKLKLVNYEDIILNEKNKSVVLGNKGQSVDVGGIAKGYAADEVKDIFKSHGIKNALIDLGGNIFALGKKPDGALWNIGIQNPFANRGAHIGYISVQNKSVVTSGNYEKYFIDNGREFHHIMDPQTGYPSESKIISTTIISDCSIDGDGLSTGVYIMGLDKSSKLIESLKGVDAIFIMNNKEIYVTSGIKDKFKVTNKEFVYVERDKKQVKPIGAQATTLDI